MATTEERLTIIEEDPRKDPAWRKHANKSGTAVENTILPGAREKGGR